MMSTSKTNVRRGFSKPARIAATRPKSLPDSMQEQIARKAYELWELRGRGHGYAVQDWLDAEELLMDEIHEARQ